MSKRRPSTVERTGSPGNGSPDDERDSVSYWLRRVFNNSFTRAGRLRRVRSWSVKIQHRGLRRTISLQAKDKALAALEARELYRRIAAQGWEATHAASFPRTRAGTESDLLTRDSRQDPRLRPEYWVDRMVRRPYVDALGLSGRALSARIEMGERAWFFWLGTDIPEIAAQNASEIVRAWLAEGWERVRSRFAREITVAFLWNPDPVIWTYTTIVTNSPQHHSKRSRRSGGATLPIAIVDAEAEVASALGELVSADPRCAYVGGFESFGRARAALARAEPGVVFANASLLTAESSGSASQGDAWKVLPYALYADSDQLFRATPGGASGYLLKRAQPFQILDPFHGAKLNALPDLPQLARVYFGQILHRTAVPSVPSGPAVSPLTHREQEIMECLSKGYSDKEIAEALRISAWTVHNHLKRVFEKLRVHSRTEAAIRHLQK